MSIRVALSALLRLLVVVLALGAGAVCADSPAFPTSYQMVAGPRQEFLFVMLTGEPSYKNSTGVPYPASGLYRNDDSVTPLWTIDWYAFEVKVTDDGRYLVRMGPWAGDLKQLAVAFYDRGNLTRAYTIAELVSDPSRLTYTVSHFFWRSEIAFDPNRRLLNIATVSEDSHLFDVKSGEIIAATKTAETPLVGQFKQANGVTGIANDLRICFSGPWLIAAGSEGGVEAVSLDQLTELQRVNIGDSDLPPFRLRLADATERLVNFAGHVPQICGRGDNGREIMISVDTLSTLKIKQRH